MYCDENGFDVSLQKNLAKVYLFYFTKNTPLFFHTAKLPFRPNFLLPISIALIFASLFNSTKEN